MPNIPNPDGPVPTPFPLPTPWPRPHDVPGRFERYPWKPIPDLKLRWGRAQVKIMIVVDGQIGFDDRDFGLQRVIVALTDITHPDFPSYVKFTVVKNTRSAQGSRTDADNYGFTFTPGSLGGFDELWLFGIGAELNFLPDAEINVITDFMNAGGGVLAMGDHEDLGLGLCGKLPRVRNMRKWWFSPLPAGEPVAPDSTDLTRIDTVQEPRTGGGVNAGQQSDDTPQPIHPVYRTRFSLGRLISYPHPVLCGPRGAIRVFPDHQHEGWCIVPPDLGLPVGFGATPAALEYPGGVSPEVIARGYTVAGRTKGGFTLPTSDPFGLLSAYDGHLPAAGVGRVLVDSTWHHWFQINLDGFATSAVPEAQTQWADIQAFFRNTAVWLAPAAKQARMRKSGQLISLTLYPAVEFLPGAIAHRHLDHIYYFGIYARDALGRLAPQCQSWRWMLDTITDVLPIRIRELLWEDPAKLPEKDLAMYAWVVDRLVTTAYGGAMVALGEAMEKFDGKDPEALVKKFDEITGAGAKRVMPEAIKALEASMKVMHGLAGVERGK